MIDYQNLIDALAQDTLQKKGSLQEKTPLQQWAQLLPEQIARGLSQQRWGDLPQWQQVLADLPALTPSTIDFRDGLTIGAPEDASDAQRQALKTTLMGLHPWRKGPYDLFGLNLDTEWRSDWKWDRLLPHIRPLDNHLVLDVGCGNGYHCWRMYGAGARRVIGIDPSPRFVHQFYAIKSYALKSYAVKNNDPTNQDLPVDVLPLGIEDVPPDLAAFDTVFSMGVLYHRRSPLDHLRELKACLKPGGQLVLETLITEGELGHTLVPEGRYAKMRNVWFLPSAPTLVSWLRKTGFKNVRVADTAVTTVEEQRATEWMNFESLADFLDPNDSSRTLEGHPAPQRAIILADNY
ncbi:MAG: tRNA 5-methoxyuridine(34)/uridine 5-oxyacetic acid(34) synthase CmoB [Porticoccaceae bacterium]|nr:tRNA 5-methoxyuridine(34)/uridine 5-oxyacetic acid(34) synthase CmoB [Porticoccaceae bacterium]